MLPGQPANLPEAGEYQVQVLGTQGEVLVDLPVRAYQAEVEERVFTAINAVLPLPEQPAARLLLLKDGQVLAEQPLQVNPVTAEARLSNAAPTANGYLVRWEMPEQPVLVRYSSDGGATWVTLGVDVKGGELMVDPTTLPAPDGIFEVLPADTWK